MPTKIRGVANESGMVRAMKRWLLKSDPDDYSTEVLERDGRTEWDGVKNPTALIHMRSMSAGDGLLMYHSGKQKAIVATAVVVRGPYADPGDAAGKLVWVDIEFERWLDHPVVLAAIKADSFFAGFDLVRISRLLVMPVSGGQWKRLMAMSAKPR